MQYGPLHPFFLHKGRVDCTRRGLERKEANYITRREREREGGEREQSNVISLLPQLSPLGKEGGSRSPALTFFLLFFFPSLAATGVAAASPNRATELISSSSSSSSSSPLPAETDTFRVENGKRGGNEWGRTKNSRAASSYNRKKSNVAWNFILKKSEGRFWIIRYG